MIIKIKDCKICLKYFPSSILYVFKNFSKQEILELSVWYNLAFRTVTANNNLDFYYWKISDPPKFWYGPPVDSGLLVISKYPILHSEFHSYHIGVLSDSASDKGYIYCKIKVGDKILHLFNTHLQASYLNRAETAH